LRCLSTELTRTASWPPRILGQPDRQQSLTCDPGLARETRPRLRATHLERDIDDIGGDPRTIVDELWRPIAAEQRERRSRGDPMTHRLLELHSTSRRSERLLGPLQALIVNG
jgi:hypothetical protein